MMRKTEIPHNTPEQVKLYLEAALELTEALDPPEDLRAALFVQAVTMLGAKQLFFEQAPTMIPNMAIPKGR